MTITTPPSGFKKGNWNEQKNKLKAEFPVLTDADMRFDNGKKDEMFSRLEKKLGKTREELNAIMEK